jgi:hypothetical protein
MFDEHEGSVAKFGDRDGSLARPPNGTRCVVCGKAGELDDDAGGTAHGDDAVLDRVGFLPRVLSKGRCILAKIDKLLDKLREHLDPGEEPVASVLGAYEVKRMGVDSVRNGVMAATDRRLVFYAKKMGGYDFESFPYENITSFEQGKSMSGGSVTFIASGNQAKLKYISKGRHARIHRGGQIEDGQTFDRGCRLG